MSAKRSTVREYLEALLIAGIFLGFTNTFVVKTFYIPSGSMEDTLLVGDHLFVNRMIYGPAPTAFEKAVMPVRDIERGDIVIFRSVERPRIDMVKRCVGLPDDTIQIVDKELFLNGRRVDDDAYVEHKDRRILAAEVHQRDQFGPYTVSEGHYFCMGDNRDFSHDSRFWDGVPRAFVKGRAAVIYWSYGGETSDGVWRGAGQKLRQIGSTVAGFFTRTRWGRTLKLVR